MTSNNNLHDIDALRIIKVDKDIVLRPLQSQDAERILEILEADPTIRKRVSVVRNIHSESDVYKEIMAYNGHDEVIRYAILKDNQCIGLISLWRLGKFRDINEPDTYGFGYFLDPTERGKGLIPTVLRTLMDVARASLRPKKFIAFCEDDNPASIRVLEKSGFIATDEVIYFPDEGWHERKYVITL